MLMVSFIISAGISILDPLAATGYIVAGLLATAWWQAGIAGTAWAICLNSFMALILGSVKPLYMVGAIAGYTCAALAIFAIKRSIQQR